MSTKSGILAAQRQGIHVGPRGGKFYFTTHGTKVYGTPPTGRVSSSIQVSDVSSRHSYIVKGAHVKADLEGEGWVHGKVTSVNARNRTARVRLSDGGEAIVPYAALRPKTEPTRRRVPRATSAPHSFVKGQKVKADMEGEGWLSGTIEKLHKNHALVALSDGTYAKVPFGALKGRERAKTANVGVHDMARDVRGSATWKEQFETAMREGGFAQFLAKNKLVSLGEASGRHALGTYRGFPPEVRVSDRAAFASAAARLASRPLLGPNTWAVRPDYSPEGYQRKTMVHEVAHYMHLARDADGARKFISKETDKEIWDHYRSQHKGWVPSQYSKTNEKEWFAEASVAYVYHPVEFRQNDPKGFALVQKARREAGVE